MLIFLLFEETIHNQLILKYNYHIFIDIFVYLNIFYTLQNLFFFVSDLETSSRLLLYSLPHLKAYNLQVRQTNSSIQITLAVSILNLPINFFVFITE